MRFESVVPRDPDNPGPVWLDGSTVTLTRTPGGILRAELADRCYRRVVVLRALPLSLDDEYLSIRCEDEEVGILRRLTDVDEAQQQLIREELERRYFRPQITRVLRIKDLSGTYEWQTKTDRGPAQFSTRHPRHSAVPAGVGRWIISDLNQNRYELVIAELEDNRSRKILDELLA